MPGFSGKTYSPHSSSHSSRKDDCLKMNHGPFAKAEEVGEISNRGERYVPLTDPYNAAMHLGHMAAYKLALRFAYGQKVLDLGCGTGYGSHFLAYFGAGEVTAADLNETAVNYACKTYSHPRLRYLRLSGDNSLPFAGQTFDFVFCSQVIEHIHDPVRLLKEIRRILKPGGFCLVTAPNKALFSPDPNENPNEYHINEMNLSEFIKLGRRVFPHIKAAGIPQNCLKQNPDNSVSVKPNEEINPADYRMRFDNLESCENLLLFGHTQTSGQFVESLPGKYLEVSQTLAPLFWDAAVKKWVVLGIYPKTRNLCNIISRSPAVVKAKVFSLHNNLYRIDIGLARGGEYDIEVILRRESPESVPVFHLVTEAADGKLRLVFPPVKGSARELYYLELRTQCNFRDRWLNRKGLPRFEFLDGRLPRWTFHSPEEGDLRNY